MKHKALLEAVAVALMAAACGDSPTGSENGPPVTSVVIDSTLGPLTRVLTAGFAENAAAEVTYWSEGTPRLRVTSSTIATQQRVLLPRLRASTTYSYELRSVTAAGERGPISTGEFRTGALPPDIAALKMTGSGTPTQPLSLVELMFTTTGFSGVIIVDHEGQVVWFWRAGGGFVNGAVRRANGNFVFLDEPRGIYEVAPDGSIVNHLPQTQQENPYGTIHHDVITTPRNTLYFLARETRPVNGTTVVGEAIWEWSPEQRSVVKLWSAFDFLNWPAERAPASLPNNWLHANSLQIGPRGSLIVSFRNLDQVISIAPDFKSLDWRLSGPGGNITMSDADRFYGQHSPVEVAANRVIIFDNGFGRPGGDEFSRVLELQIDPATRRATKVWEFRPNPVIKAMRVGSVRRYPNGNTVAAFGWGQGFPMAVYEVTADGRIVWQLKMESGIDRYYRATPLTSVAGEVEVR